MIDRSKLPSAALPQKAVWRCFDGLVFGTLTTITARQLDNPVASAETGRKKGPLELICPAAHDFVMKLREESVQLPLREGWESMGNIYSDDYGVANFTWFYLKVPHQLEFLHPRGGNLPEETLWMLSAYLQIGKEVCFESYRDFLTLRQLKFLPFLITRTHFYYFVYRPSVAATQAACNNFEAVLAQLDPVMEELPTIAALAYALVRLDEVAPTAGFELIRDARHEMTEALSDRLGQQPSLGFVYQHLGGDQNAMRFAYDMYS